MGRHAHSIFPQVTTKPWYYKENFDRETIVTGNRLISDHTRCKAHLTRINILDTPICDCSLNYQTIDHMIWDCTIIVRDEFLSDMQGIGVKEGTPVRDILGMRKFDAIPVIKKLFKTNNTII